MRVLAVAEELEYDGYGYWWPGAAERSTGRCRVIIACDASEVAGLIAQETEDVDPGTPAGCRYMDSVPRLR